MLWDTSTAAIALEDCAIWEAVNLRQCGHYLNIQSSQHLEPGSFLEETRWLAPAIGPEETSTYAMSIMKRAQVLGGKWE